MMKIRFDLYTIQRQQRAQTNKNKNLYSLVFETVAHLALATAASHHSISIKNSPHGSKLGRLDACLVS